MNDWSNLANLKFTQKLLLAVCFSIIAIYLLYNLHAIFLSGQNIDRAFNRVFEFSGFLMTYHALYTLFLIRKDSVGPLSLIFICFFSAATSEIMFFEERLFEIIVELGFGGYFTNHQQPKAIIGLAIYLIFLISLILRKKRSFPQVFNFLTYSIVIGTTMMFHILMISGAMRDMESYYSQKLLDIYTYYKKLNTVDESYCNYSDINCFKITNGKSERTLAPIEEHLLNVVNRGNRQSMGTSMFNDVKYMNNYVYLFKVDSTKTGDIFYNNSTFHTAKRKLLNYYFSLNIMAHFFWAAFNLILVYIHANMKKTRNRLSIGSHTSEKMKILEQDK